MRGDASTVRRWVRSRAFAALAGAAVALGAGGAGAAWAQPVPVVVVTSRPEPSSAGVPLANRVAAAVGEDALVGANLARELERRYAAPAVTGDPLADARDRARAARRAWTQAAAGGDDAAAQAALAQLDAATQELEARPEALDASPESRAALQQALVFLAERHDTAGAAGRAEEAMRRLARLDPALVLGASAASPGVREHFARASAATPRASLTVTVESAPRGCAVVRDGRPAGNAPVDLLDLAAGVHRVALRCGAAASLVHPVEVAPQTHATIAIDAQLDAALVAGGMASLRYPTASQGRRRLAGDLTQLGRALGARRVFGVLAREDRVVVVDVATGTEVEVVNATDGTRLRALTTDQGAPPSGAQGEGDGAQAQAGDGQRAQAAGAANGAQGQGPAAQGRTGSAQAQAGGAEGAAGGRVPALGPAELPSAARDGGERRGGGGAVPAGAAVVGTLGLVGVGVGVLALVRGEGYANASEQAADAAMRRGAEEERDTARTVQWAALAGGSALLVAGIVWGVLGAATSSDDAARSRRASRGVVRAGVAPTAGGAAVLLGGAF